MTQLISAQDAEIDLEFIQEIIPSSDGPIKIYKKECFDGMRKAGKLAAQTLDYITPFVKIGVTTQKLNDLCHEFICDHGAIPAPLNYKGFPKSICTSINEVICHGIPEKRNLKNGDILNIDVTVILDGWYGDTSRMFPLGKIPKHAENLIRTTYEAFMLGIEAVKPGATTGDIGAAIEAHAKTRNYGVVRDFCGHGLGRVFHDNPGILHYGKPGSGVPLIPGMFFTVEPMFNCGKHEAMVLNDGWTAVTRDRTLSAQFEHSLAVTETGYEIFTLSPAGHAQPPYSIIE